MNFKEEIEDFGLKFHNINFWVLNTDWESDLSETSMSELIIEWVDGICEFCRVPRCGPGLGFLADFGLFIKDSTFFDWDWFL